MVAYGEDEVTGYFISVSDERLMVLEETGGEIDEVLYNISEDGSGAYFRAHTGQFGFGAKVETGTMRQLWKRFEVPEEDLRKLDT